MPQIVGPDALDGSTLDELAEDGVDAVAPAGESTAQSWPGILFSAAEGGQELDAALGELLTEAWRPEVAIADDEAGGAFGEVVSGGEFLPIAWSELDLADDTRPADARMQAEAVERLMREVIMAIGSLSPEAPAARGARELANRECEAVNDGELRTVRDLGADPLPEPIFHHLQVRCLAHEGCPVDTGERREEGGVVASEISEEGAVLLQAEVLPDNFHRQHFAVGQGRRRAAFAEAFARQQSVKTLVNQAKPRNNKIVQVHGVASFELSHTFARSRAVCRPASTRKKNSHIGLT